MPGSSRFIPIRSIPPRSTLRRGVRGWVLMVAVTLSLRCAPPPADVHDPTAPAVQAVDYGPVRTPRPLDLLAARGETLGFAIRVRNAPRGAGLRVRPAAPAAKDARWPAGAVAVYRMVPIPAPTPDPAFVRHTGLSADRRELPPALIPAAVNKKGVTPVDRDEWVWIDLPIPAEAPPGDYSASLDLAGDARGHAIASAPLTLHVYDFVMPAQKHLQLSGDLDWPVLAATYHEAFADLPEPWLLTRQSARSDPALRRLDRLMEMGRADRVALQLPRLQPVVKLPPGQPPLIEWADYDSVVTPWLAERDYWELPRFDGYDRLDAATRAAYWREVLGHFDRNDWLARSALVADAGGSAPAEAPRGEPRDPKSAIRILCATAPPPAAPPDPRRMPPAPLGVSDSTRPIESPRTWLSAGDRVLTREADFRSLAFLAAARHATVVRFGAVFAASTSLPATQTPWFYPGTYFGQDHPLESIAAKWARRAQQDYEYFHLASQRGREDSATLLASLAARPLAAAGDPVGWPITRMLAGTVDAGAFPAVQKLLGHLIETTEPGRQSPDRTERLQLDQTRWLAAQERPLVAATETTWTREKNVLNLDLHALVAQPGPSHNTPGSLGFDADALPPGWHAGAASAVPPLSDRVTREQATASVDLDALAATATFRQPLALRFIDGYTRQASTAGVLLPVAVLARRGDGAITPDGTLGEWATDDLLHTGPLTAYFSRPAAQSGDAPPCLPADLYGAYDDKAIYLAFHVADLPPARSHAVKNSVDYRDGRAWGETLCQFLFQPVYTDNTTGPVVHVVVKPSAQWIETRQPDGNWRPAPEVDVLYADSADGPNWSGELALPLASLRSPKGEPIALIRFNFARHDPITGQSASYAGPIDTFRDAGVTGALVLRR